MNEMELLQELAQETPLPAPAELDGARARLVAAIAADPAAGRVPAVAGTTQPEPYPSSGQPPEPYPSSGQPPEPRRPAAPEPVQGAVKLMWGGAAGTAAQVIIALFYVGDVRGYHLRMLGHQLTTAQLIHWRPLIVTLAITVGLVEIALWLCTARAAGQGRNWARVLSAVLAGLATLQLGGIHGLADLFFAVLTWLTGLAAVWLLWRPSARAFFRPQVLSGNPAAPGSDTDRRH
jgi:hypothetical protein